MSFGQTRSRQLLASFALIALCCFLTAAAQSGRRGPKKAPAPSPTATPEPAPELTSDSKKPERPKPELTVVLGMDRTQNLGGFRNINLVLTTVAERIERNRSVELRQVLTDFHRGEAVERAKREMEAYVVLLEFHPGPSNRVSGSDADFSIHYWVFSPQTGKLKMSGQTYPQDVRNRGIFNPRTPTVYGDYLLQDAAEDVAERILAAFNLKSSDGPLSWPR